MKKGYIITAVALLLVVCFAVGFVMRDSIGNILHRGDPEGTTAPPPVHTDADDYMAILRGSVDYSEPIMKTDIDGIYYTMTKTGEVSFFKVNGDQISEIAPSGVYDVSVTCTNQQIPARVYYYTAGDGVVTGYGLFTTDSSDAQVYIYDYAFFKLSNLPDAYASSGAYLLLVDTTKEDFYSNNKVYEEDFRYYPNSGETSYILSVDNRAFDTTGAFRADYAMLTDNAVKRCGENFLFFSARQYHLFTKDNNMDIYMAGGSGNNRDNNRYIEDVVDFWFSYDANGVLALQRNGEDGFNLISYDGGTETVVKEFKGNYAENYIRSGDWLLDKNTFALYDLNTGASKTLKLENTNQFIADIFVTDGNVVFLRGASEGIAAVAIGTVDGGAVCYYNDMFSGIFSPMILRDGSVMMSVAADKEGSAYSIKIFNTAASEIA
ncbi:MAG: hypothetical protein IJ766_02090 [Clostridia bacterium]|nr:hypothetical protein [Clostridia bacterium]